MQMTCDELFAIARSLDDARNKVLLDVSSQTKQLRDELAKAKAELAKQYSNLAGEINSKCDEVLKLTERAERAESEMRLQMRQADKATKERDDLRAKVAELESKLLKDAENFQFIAKKCGMSFNALLSELQGGKKIGLYSEPEQPLMIMRVDSYLWEITEAETGPGEGWAFYKELKHGRYLYSRPITPDELRSWLPVEKQQPGEVLFEGVRTIWPRELQDLQSGHAAVISNETFTTEQYHVTIRKAGA